MDQNTRGRSDQARGGQSDPGLFERLFINKERVSHNLEMRPLISVYIHSFNGDHDERDLFDRCGEKIHLIVIPVSFGAQSEGDQGRGDAAQAGLRIRAGHAGARFEESGGDPVSEPALVTAFSIPVLSAAPLPRLCS